MCTQEQQNIIKERFEQAYAIRFGKDDIDWKKTFNKDRKTGELREGTPLAYLNWAVAWRTFKQVYPDGQYRVIETPEFSPLWNVNGYGMVKVAMSSTGIEYIETFPIMQGGQNDSVKVENIDGRDVNDAIQRALTKLVARFGVGLYIYEGKLDAPNTHYERNQGNTHQQQQTAPNEPKQEQKQVLRKSDPASAKQVCFIKKVLSDKGYVVNNFVGAFSKTPEEMTAGEASEAIDTIKSWPDNKPAEDDLPF